MNDPTKSDTPQAENAGTHASQGAPAGQKPAPSEETPAAEAGGELEALQQEHASLKDRLLRTLADMENLRRRTEREVADARSYGMANFAREMLVLADNLHRAVQNFPADARAALEPHVSALLEGVELTERDFQSRLARFGVKKIDPSGAKFDPNHHEAMFEIPDETQPSGMVAQVIEPGYTIGDRVLRPAKVGVTRGGPKA